MGKFSTIAMRIFACLGLLLGSLAAFGAKKPNIVMYFIDDLGWTDVSFMGSKYYETPHVDRLAREGMKFMSAYSNAPNCAPSRACLMSGQYSPRHGVFTVGNSDRGKAEFRKLIPIKNKTVLADKFVTLAESLKAPRPLACEKLSTPAAQGPSRAPGIGTQSPARPRPTQWIYSAVGPTT